MARRRLTRGQDRARVVDVGVFDSGPAAAADDVVRDGWRYAEMPPVDLALPVDWRAAAAENRSWGFHLHSWEFLDPVVRQWARTGDVDLRGWCLDRAVSWVLAHVEGRTASPDGGEMAWYDMALALRAPRLAWLFRETSDQAPDDERLPVLYRAVLAHQEALGRAEAFNPRNNHGFYTAVGQMLLAREMRPLPGMAALDRQGRARLQDVSRMQFLEDGGHAEHSPEYHRMLARDFRSAAVRGLVGDRTVLRRLARSGALLGWMVQPDRRLVQLGDTGEVVVDDDEITALADEAGTPARTGLRVATFPDSGYAFARSDDEGTYVALMAAFHSRAHKHADDATVVWHDRGLEWLVDAGRFGYVDLLPADSPARLQGFYYSRPERQFVESTRAHTTVSCDGEDHARRDRRPYGAGDLSSVLRDGHAELSSFVDHGHWTHRRSVVVRPGQWLLLTDEVSSTDGTEHVFRSWQTLPGELVVRTARGSGIVRAVRTGTHERLWIRSFGRDDPIEPVTGQTEPEMRGWRSRRDRELTPAWSLGRVTAPTRHHVFQVLLQIGGEAPRRLPEHPFDGRTTFGEGTAVPVRDGSSSGPRRSQAAVARLQDTLRHAAEHVPLYRDVLDAAGPRPTLRDFPLLTKEAVAAAGRSVVARHVDPGDLRVVRTGGTTGEPAAFFRDPGDGVRELAHVRDAWRAFGISPEDPVAVLVARSVGDDGEVHIASLTGDLWLGGAPLTDAVLRRHLERLRDRRPALLRGYPSALALLAELVLREGGPPIPGLRATGSSSETLLPHQRDLLRRAFGVPHADLYGQTEHVALACSCPGEDGLHVDEAYGWIELVDADGEVVDAPDVVGEIVATGFGNRAAPLVRYRTGDRAAWAGGPCTCGHVGPRLRRVEGRLRDEVVDLAGRPHLVGPWFYSALASLPGVSAFQLEQPAAGHLLVDVVLRDGARTSDDELQRATAHLAGFVVDVRRADDVSRSAAGKVPVLRSRR